MRIVIAGGHGKIALHLEALLAGRGDSVVGLVRNPDHIGDVTATGAQASVIDLERCSVTELAEHLQGADAVVFAAGAGPDSGIARKDTVDRAAAVLLADAAMLTGVWTYVLVSSIGADRAPHEPAADDVFGWYLAAKAAAEDYLRETSLDWTILRPVRLTDAPATGRVALTEPGPGIPTAAGEVTRADVAAVVAELLHRPAARRTLELTGGDVAITDAVTAFAERPTELTAPAEDPS